MKVKGKKIVKKQRTNVFLRKKTCRFCRDKNRQIDYKDIDLLESFIKDRGKMVSSRLSGNCAKHQRRVAEAIKRARYLALLPYVKL